ncbi:MAG: hypothetical protein OHK0052_10380 [Anaerolineales bacterium]
MTDPEKFEREKQEKYQIGVTILLLLAVLTAGEFMIAAAGANWVNVFILIALLKAFLVVRDYMHLGRIFSNEEEH